MDDTKMFYAVEIGNVNNLITTMTVEGASEEEIRNVVMYSKLLLDAAKAHHDLSSFADKIGLASLRKKYLLITA